MHDASSYSTFLLNKQGHAGYHISLGINIILMHVDILPMLTQLIKDTMANQPGNIM